MSYTEHTWVDGETITAEKLNNLEEGVAEAGGAKYDLVIRFSNLDGHTDLSDWEISDAEIISGSIQACEEKLMQGTPVDALLIFRFGTGGADPNRIMADTYYRLIGLDIHYSELTFYGGGFWGYPIIPITIYYDSNYEISDWYWD